jgi:diaminopimelate epimerase
MTSRPITFLKGHGTGNDFIVLPNLDGALSVSVDLVAALCDRHRGLGADGVLIVSRTAAEPVVASQAGLAPYFMDYRNADGSVAEMCGNGARVFVAFLREAGLTEDDHFQIATRGGPREVRVRPSDGLTTIGMGPAEFLEVGLAVSAAEEPGRTRPAAGVLMPNPHAVTWVEDVADAGALRAAPEVSPRQAFPDGANVEFVHVVTHNHIQMRVFERGVGETLSCGTGACAAAVATVHRTGAGPAGQSVRVDVPGGELRVLWRPDGEVELTGPAVLVARGTLDRDWWDAHA